MIARIVTSIRRNAIAWLALFVALTGTSMAASHYVVSSTKQIKPSVIKKLRGNRGPAGARGAEGPAGATGKEGVGTQGSRGPTGPTGATGTKGTEGKQGEKGETSFGGPTGPTGAEGAAGATGATGAKGTTGEKGATGEAGSGGVKAYAHISDEGEATESSGFTGATVKFEPKSAGGKKEPEPGVYCISGLSFTPKNVQVTLDSNEIPEFEFENTKKELKTEPVFPTPVQVHAGKSSESNCPAGTQVTVETLALVEEGATEEGFAMGFYVELN